MKSRTVRSVEFFLWLSVLALLGGRPQFNAAAGASRGKSSVPTADELTVPFHAVATRGGFVFAVNSNGMYRASLKERRWQRLPCPVAMPLFGLFASQVESADPLLYFTPQEFTPAPGRDTIFGLYASTDYGETWKLISREHDFQHVFQDANGRLYAIVVTELTPPRERPAITSHMVMSRKDAHGRKWFFRYRALESKNGGVNWRDITGSIGTGVSLHRVFPHPDKPNLICLEGNCVRNYILEPNDERYDVWTMTKRWEWRKGKESETDFFKPNYSSSTILYKHRATLTNYFDYPFKSSPELPAFELLIDDKDYQFESSAPKVVLVTVRFLPDELVVKALDVSGGVEFWRLRVITPMGERVQIAGTEKMFEVSQDFEEAKRLYQAKPEFRIIEISKRQPYGRELDLGLLYDFPKPGTYKVQLAYDSIGWGWNNGQRAAEWAGSFTSPIFTVQIK